MFCVNVRSTFTHTCFQSASDSNLSAYICYLRSPQEKLLAEETGRSGLARGKPALTADDAARACAVTSAASVFRFSLRSRNAYFVRLAAYSAFRGPSAFSWIESNCWYNGSAAVYLR